MVLNPLGSGTGHGHDRPQAFEGGVTSLGEYQWRQIHDADALWRLFRVRALTGFQEDDSAFDLADYRVRVDRDDLRSVHFAIVPARAKDAPPVAYLRFVYPEARIRSERTADILRCCGIPLQQVELGPLGSPRADSGAGWLGAQIADSVHRGASVVEPQWLAHDSEAPFHANGEQAWKLVREMGVAVHATHVVWCGELRDLSRASV